MTKIFCLLVIVLLSASLAIGQKGAKPTVANPTSSVIKETEKAWANFYPRFRTTIVGKKWSILNKMFAENFDGNRNDCIKIMKADRRIILLRKPENIDSHKKALGWGSMPCFSLIFEFRMGVGWEITALGIDCTA
jgi:hypothetical protein